MKTDSQPPKKKGPKPGTPRKRFLRDNEDLVHQMHLEHLCGKNLNALEREFGYTSHNIKKAFERLGLRVILDTKAGQFPKTMKRHTRAEIRAIVNASKNFFSVPKALRSEWREDWDLKQRSFLIRLMVRRHGWPYERPKGKFSSNVQPFDYTTPAAHEVVARRNAGKPSREWQTRLKPCSQGVIFEDNLYCWVEGDGYVRGHFTKGRGRERLHRLIYERHHGPIPSDGVIRYADGNPNNLDPVNLVLATKNDVCRENQAAHHTQVSRERTQQMLKLQNSTQKGTNDDLTESIFGQRVRGSGGRGRAAA